jgi:hypothetical protein
VWSLEGRSAVSLLWLSEPDASQHESECRKTPVGIGQSDQNPDSSSALKDKGVFEKTDLLIVSDHGFSTIDRGPDLIKSLKRPASLPASNLTILSPET